MTYGSTRGTVHGVSFSEAVLQGIAPDGGLFVPEQAVHFDSLDLANMAEMSYSELAATVFRKYATDFTDAEIDACVQKAYGPGSAFPENAAPLSYVSSTLSVLELWHGPTAAFKDMALQILPELMAVARKKRADKTGDTRKIAILTATSGDTGKAALEGFRDAEGISILVFYPENGVSEMQKFQMVTQEGGNVRVVAVRGNFDDAQTGVKKIFADAALCARLSEAGYELSSANSINIGRLLPQIVYYYYAYFTMVRDRRLSLGSPLNFVVPTGNFGNILACYYAKKSGLPVGRIVCAVNSNRVVSDFLTTGVYNANRKFVTTVSPAMDILVSSNLERLLYDVSDRDDRAVAQWMLELQAQRVYSVGRRIMSHLGSTFWSASATEAETLETIGNLYKEYKYLIDPHTAVGINVYDKYVISTGDMMKTVAVSTASPFKFGSTVLHAVAPQEAESIQSEFQMQEALSARTGCPIPEPLRGLDQKAILHERTCNPGDMPAEVLDFLQGS